MTKRMASVCSAPSCCSDCGVWCNDVFLCGEHEGYEIIEERARVYGSNDVLATEYATRCLEQAGLHPFVFSRKAYRNMDIAPNWSYREFGNHNAAELKILLPFSEVCAGETLLRELALLSR
jgi:tRNA-dihydrouridine synthase